MGLLEYRRKRDPKKTPEPFGPKSRKAKHLFVIQKHDASHLHYDFRLELDGTLKSWAVPKGPSYDPSVKRMAIQVEDHPVSYARFEGLIPQGEYGGGEVIVWDTGTWRPIGDPRAGYRKGRLEFELKGKKMKGLWLLFRIRGAGERAQWFLVKRHDGLEHPSPDPHPVVDERPESVLSKKLLTRDLEARGLDKGRTIAKRAKVWHSNKTVPKAKTALGRLAERSKTKKAASKKGSKKKSAGLPTLGFVEPELATLVEYPPVGDQWIHEIKFDGYRTLVQLRNGEDEPPKFMTRKGLDWTDRYLALESELANLDVKSALIDGEIVALDEKGRSDFSALQKAFKEGRDAKMIFYVFDLLELDGKDLRRLPLHERKSLLEALLKRTPRKNVLYSEDYSGSAEKLLAKGCELGLEGVISKDRNAPYTSGRSGVWLKSKCRQGQEFIITGYTPPRGSRSGFGSLVLGAYDPDGELRYLGRVGTGFDREKIALILRKTNRLKTTKSPFPKKVPLDSQIQWLRPKMVAEFAFHGFTHDGHIRQGVFRGLREDKPAREVTVDHAEKPTEVTEVPMPAAKTAKGAKDAPKLTHPDKVLIPETKVTKRQLRDYLVAAAPWMLPHLADRPLALVRCPDDTNHECFFQKNLMRGTGPGLHGGKARNPKGGTTPFVFVDDQTGLESLAQMGVIEIHPWGTHRDHVLKPDLLVFDLDPDDSVPWAKVAEAAIRLRKLLERLGLKSFLKISGNKGLHLHVPIEPTVTWEAAKNFANAVSLALVEEDPKLYLANMSKAKRKGKIFIDFFRNGYGATSVAPYSVRTKNGGAVALPIEWKDVKKIDPRGFHIADVRKRLARRVPGGRGDPWKDYFKTAQRIPELK